MRHGQPWEHALLHAGAGYCHALKLRLAPRAAGSLSKRPAVHALHDPPFWLVSWRRTREEAGCVTSKASRARKARSAMLRPADGTVLSKGKHQQGSTKLITIVLWVLSG